ncbi:phosphotransferase [Sutcliffiella halmapala]|uniref:phosphotransferase n=1 Tax=Sutcliffiella halmapala TaxID=79882 RepID=UPI000995189A|nr:phosphotransferase [Sutcliffiella halmapala]
MSDIQYNIQLGKLCNALQLGELDSVPKAISGGLLHRMYAIETTQGKYAIKALNPQIMLRSGAMQNYINSERIANFVANNISAIPAEKFNGVVIQKLDAQFYLVFDWIKGDSLNSNEINSVHCEKIGVILADIHKTDFSGLSINYDYILNEKLIDWNYYLQKGQENSIEWVNLLLENIDNLIGWNTKAIKAGKLLVSNMVISHRDLDPKNVMWNNQDNPVLIDWESAGYINPMQDLIETAIYWSQNEIGSIDKERFFAFIGGYKKRNEILHADWRIVLANGFLGKLGWLEYNLKRSLWMECTDDEEQQMGTTQVTGTIHEIRRYADIILELEDWLNNEL